MTEVTPSSFGILKCSTTHARPSNYRLPGASFYKALLYRATSPTVLLEGSKAAFETSEIAKVTRVLVSQRRGVSRCYSYKRLWVLGRVTNRYVVHHSQHLFECK